jgi:hypothetical protein
MQQSPIEAVPGVEYRGRQYRDAAAVRAAIAREETDLRRQLNRRRQDEQQSEQRDGERRGRQRWESQLGTLHTAVASARAAATEAQMQASERLKGGHLEGIDGAAHYALQALIQERLQVTAEALVAEHLAREPRQPEG